VIDGVPAGLALTESDIQKDLDRRRPGSSEFVSQRKEEDKVEILSGVWDGRTLGSPITALVFNKDKRSKDYEDIKNKFRPGHADYTYFKKYGLKPQPGGGRSSGRETVGRVAAGAIAKVLLRETNTIVSSCVSVIGGIEARERNLEFAETHPLRCPDPAVAKIMEETVRNAKAAKDSVGGVVEILVKGVPPGLGDPVFDKLDALIAHGILSIGAVKGVEIGAGFRAASMTGAQCNDPMGSGGFASNNAGGILGGVSTGQDIFIRFAVKPTPSIGIEQETITIDGRDTRISIGGRHDPCICPRIAVVGEAMVALVLADCILARRIHG
jgi:chorismate synthase